MCTGKWPGELAFPCLGLRCSWEREWVVCESEGLLGRPPTPPTDRGLPISDLTPHAPDHVLLALLVSRP